MTPDSQDRSVDVPFLKTLGVSLRDNGDDFAEMEVTIDQRHLNYYGGTHGGLIAALADTVCFFPKPLIPSGLKVTTVDLNISYVRAAHVGDHYMDRWYCNVSSTRPACSKKEIGTVRLCQPIGGSKTAV